VAAARGDARLRVRPPEVPQVAAIRLDIGLTKSGCVAGLVPFGRFVEMACVETDARELVGDLAGVVEVAVGEVRLVNRHVVPGRVGAIAFERVRHGHRALRHRLLLRRARELDGLAKKDWVSAYVPGRSSAT